MLASAHRDELVFEHADRFDAMRSNNDAHLGFGAGAHSCAAHHLSVRLAADALAALLGPAVTYEPMVNARLPKRLQIR